MTQLFKMDMILHNPIVLVRHETRIPEDFGA